MQLKTAEPREWPVIAHVIAPIAEWWRRRADVRKSLSDLDAFGPGEMARMAQDVGISASDLRTLAAHCSDAAELLERRLEALGLSAEELAHSAPAELRDMERLCTLCGSKHRCAHDLATDPDDPAWRQYCPNKDTLTSLARTTSA
jgi:hypothetical protein